MYVSMCVCNGIICICDLVYVFVTYSYFPTILGRSNVQEEDAEGLDWVSHRLIPPFVLILCMSHE